MAGALLGAQSFESPRVAEGRAPMPAPLTIGWGEAFLEVPVGLDGAAAGIRTLRTTPSLAATLTRSVEGWRFEPARADGRAVEAPILVAAIYRPPTLYSTPAPGEPPNEVDRPSDAVPFPIHAPPPPYPPRALGDGAVLVEVLVDAEGVVRSAAPRGPPGGFDEAATTTARAWRFRAARRGGVPVPVYAYLVFGFSQPVVVASRR